jgi:hypothetical protein
LRPTAVAIPPRRWRKKSAQICQTAFRFASDNRLKISIGLPIIFDENIESDIDI